MVNERGDGEAWLHGHWEEWSRPTFLDGEICVPTLSLGLDRFRNAIKESMMRPRNARAKNWRVRNAASSGAPSFIGVSWVNDPPDSHKDLKTAHQLPNRCNGKSNKIRDIPDIPTTLDSKKHKKLPAALAEINEKGGINAPGAGKILYEPKPDMIRRVRDAPCGGKRTKPVEVLQ